MENFAVIIFIIILLLVLSTFSAKLKLPYPILLLAAGLAIGYIPAIPTVALNPEIVFLIFLPPILYDASYKSSWLDFKREIKPIATLAVTLIFFTTLAVGIAAHQWIPGFSWPLAFLLGAIISPPDAVAATSITKGMGLNRRVLIIIEGESLVNDASALIAYRQAMVAVISGSFIFWKAGLNFLLVACGGLLIGLLVGVMLVFAHRRITDNPVIETVLSLLTPFVAYLCAELVHASGILAVVSAGFYISWHAREIIAFDTRLQTRVMWENVIFVLNGLVFIFMGMQIPGILSRFEENALFPMLGYGLLISVVTIVVRILWVFAGAYQQQLSARIFGKRTTKKEEVEPVSWKNVLVVAWTGTRGVVSLATALAIPYYISTDVLFPQRDKILFITYIVIFMTLVVQGSSLPLLIRTLGIKPEGDVVKEEDKDLQLRLTDEILAYIRKNLPQRVDERVVQRLTKTYTAHRNILVQKKSPTKKEDSGSTSQLDFVQGLLAAELELIQFQRGLLLRFQKEDTFNEEAIVLAETELDIEELRINNMKITRVDEDENPKES